MRAKRGGVNGCSKFFQKFMKFGEDRRLLNKRLFFQNVYFKVLDSFCGIAKTILLYNGKSCCNCACEIDPKAKEVDPEGGKVNPPSNLLSFSPEFFLLVFLADHPSSRPDRTACQKEGTTVSKGGNKDGVHDEEEKGKRAGA